MHPRVLSILVLLFPVASPAALQESSQAVVEARRLAGTGDWAGAARVLEERIVEDEGDAEAWLWLGRAWRRAGEWRAALEAFDVAAHGGLALDGHLEAARVAGANGLVEEALLHVEGAVAAGLAARGRLLHEPDLAALREDERFLALLPPERPPSELFAERPRVLQAIVGEAPGDVFGWIGRDLGDADGDGKADLLVSAPWNAEGGTAAGKVYVYSGATGELLFARAGEAGETLGIGIEAAGDVDGDGRADALAGASNAGNGPGTAYVFSGKDGARLLELTVGEAGDELGRKVSGGVDLDGDGRPELLVGAPGSGPDATRPGKAYVFSGRTGEVLATLAGERAGDRFGAGNAVHADAGGKLLAIGAANAGPERRGRVYVFHWTDDGPRPHFTIEADATGAQLGGMFVSFPGDMDGDGASEVYASDWPNAAKGPSTGRIYVHSGASGERLFTLTGERAGDGFGTCTADVGDVTGDGRADLLVGAWKAPDGAADGGRCYLYACGPTAEDVALVATYTCTEPGETLGFDTTGVGDLDGDGGIDFLVTGGYSAAAGPRSGRAFVLAGPKPPRGRDGAREDG